VLGFCHSWVVETWKVFKFECFFGKERRWWEILAPFVCHHVMSFGWVIIIFAFISSLSHGSTWKFQSIVVHLLSAPSRNMLQHGFPYFYPLSTNKVNLCFSIHILQQHFPHWSFCGNIENRYHKTLTPPPSCIFMSSLLLLMPIVNIFQSIF